MSDHVFGRSCTGVLPTAVAGDGCWIIDSDGKRYLDGSGGAAVSCLGHSDAGVRAAIHEQLDKLAFAHTGFFTSEAAEHLADLLVDEAPAGIDRVDVKTVEGYRGRVWVLINRRSYSNATSAAAISPLCGFKNGIRPRMGPAPLPLGRESTSFSFI